MQQVIQQLQNHQYSETKDKKIFRRKDFNKFCSRLARYTTQRIQIISIATTEGRVILVNSCYVSQGMGVGMFQTAKVTFKVIQGHWQWCHSIGHIRFPIRLQLQTCLYLAQFLRYYSLFPKI